ncbi:MAG TPA: hypothetical protein VFO40_26270 [Chthoniobacterales bacterium]|nr:hypothetical protein [Chthoniobacterales bacterium]
MAGIAVRGYSLAVRCLGDHNRRAEAVKHIQPMNDTLYNFLFLYHLTALRWITAVAFTALLFLTSACLLNRVVEGRLLRFTLASVTTLALGGLFLFETAFSEVRADLAALEALPRTPNSQVTLKNAGNHKVYEIIIPGGPAPSEVYLGSTPVRQMSPAIIRDFDCSLLDGLRKECPDVFEFVFPTQQQAPKSPAVKAVDPSWQI